MSKTDVFAQPRTVTDIKDCFFYHKIDLPGYGTIDGDWDLRGGVNEYLGNIDFRGKRVLEMGTADGALAFEIEKRGADVVGFDLSKDYDWDIVPFCQYDYKEFLEERKIQVEKLNNAYWLSHRVHRSKAKVVYGNLYNIPPQIGPVDIITYGAILLHVRDPFLALQTGAAFAKEKIVITELCPPSGKDEPLMEFLPDHRDLLRKAMWWLLSPELIVRFLGVLGFEKTTISYHKQKYTDKYKDMYTVVGERTCGAVLDIGYL